MTTTAIRSPTFAAVVSEQLRASGLRLRREAIAAMLVAAGLFVVTLLDALVRGGLAFGFDGGGIHFHPELIESQYLFPILGVLLPYALWRGEALFENAPLLSLPIERRRHLFIKVFAGWCWLMAAVAVLLVAIVTLALLSGGQAGVDETRTILTVSPSGERVFTALPWKTQAWQWLVPLMAASVTYLLSSAFRIGVRYPLRWSVGFILGGVLLASIGPNDGLVERILEQLTGHLGLGMIISGAPSNAPMGGTVVWQHLPSVSIWLKAVALWVLGATGLLFLAASRHKD